jgi:amino acid adenylation domain-containing protein
VSRQVPVDLLHELFWQRVTASPGDVALVQGGRSVTYAELAAQARTIACRLEASGIGSGALVGLHLERSIEWVAATLAVLTVNAAVVPLPRSYPPARTREILEFGRLDAVIVTGEEPFEPPAPTRRLVLEQLLRATESRLRPGAGDPGQAAFVLCSSGSTGRPKMIVRSHRSFFHRLRWTWSQHPYADGERCCQKSHMTTTHAIYELFEPLLQGVPVTIIPDREVRDLERFWEIVRSEKISRLLVVPAQLQASLAMPHFVPPDLGVLVLMGEYVSPSLAARALAAWPASTAIYSIYGSTEASSTLLCDLRESFRPGSELPLGQPISREITAVVLDPGGRPVRPGEVGRLHIGGSALFSGYFRDPEQTAAAFIDGPDGESRLYDTADHVRLTGSGILEFVARADHVVKIRGFRVDIKEVEDALLSQPGVRAAAIVATEDALGNKALHAFAAADSVDAAAVTSTLRDRLPDYMVPSRLTVLDALPLTASGKIDRMRLQQGISTRAPSGESAPGMSGIGETVAEIWRAILGEAEFAPDASFFDVGGTSLSAFVLVHRLRERFGLSAAQLDVEMIYRLPTIQDLAAWLERIRNGRDALPDRSNPILVSLRKGRRADRAPVFFVAPAGGTLGSYSKLLRQLRTDRELIGVRDPFNWGARNPDAGFDHWVGLYLAAIKERQPAGPYFIVAYSSGAPFGYEIARRLRADGEQVAVLALVDPLGMDRGGRSRYGWWVIKATRAGPLFRSLVRMMGWMRFRPLSQVGWLWPLLSRNADATPSWRAAVEMNQVIRHRYYMLSLSGLIELNTGLPYALDGKDLDGVSPDDYLAVFHERVKAVSPEVDFEAITQVIRQYPLQVREQECYRLLPYDGEVLLFEAAAPYAGLVQAQLKPYVRRLHPKVLELGEPSERTRAIATRWGPTAPHFRSMRDDRFVAALANELDAQLQ